MESKIPAKLFFISIYSFIHSGARGETKTLFVKNLSYDTDENSLKEVFDGCVSARIPTFPDSGKPKGLVTYSIII